MLVTCLLPMKLKSGGAIPNPTQTRASSDTLLPSIALVRLAGAADAGESPCGEFIFAAVGGENGVKGRNQNMAEGVYRQVTSSVVDSACSKLAGEALISDVPSFLDDRLLFCCWPP